MGWFGKEKPQGPTPEEMAKREEGIRRFYDYHEETLLKSLAGAETLGLHVRDVVKLPLDQRLAYANKIMALFKAQEGVPFVGIKRKDGEAVEYTNSVHDTVEQILSDLRLTDHFPQQEGRNAIEELSTFTDKPGREKRKQEPDQFEQAFDELYRFLIKKLDRKKPIQPQVSKLMDAADLGKINPWIISTLLGEGITMHEGNEQEIRALIKGALIIRLKSEQWF